jgi:hypothetical protein
MRRKNSPPSGSELCWSDWTMFAPDWYRKVETALTMPGRSAHQTSRRMSGASLNG